MAKAKSRIVLSIKGAAAEEKIGRYGFFEGSYSAILQFMVNKGLDPQSVLKLGHNGTNYYIFYWKGSL